jgi:preprotein translocase SecE subunit
MAKKNTPGKGNIVVGFLGEVRQEMTHVTWPTRSEAMTKSAIVVAISVITGIYLGGLDFVLTSITGYLFK